MFGVEQRGPAAELCWAAAALRFGLVGGGWWFCWTGCRGRPRASARSRWSAAPARGPTLLHRPELGSGCRGGSTRFATLPDVKMIASRPNKSKAQLLLLLKNMDADTNYWQVSKRLLGRKISVHIDRNAWLLGECVHDISVENPGQKNIKGISGTLAG